jgi:hypothetical protein
MLTLQKQFGKYTITLTEGEQYTTDSNTGLYEHSFEIALTGTYERHLIINTNKKKTLDPYLFFENYYDCIEYKHTKIKGMTKDDWENMIQNLAMELKLTRRELLKTNQ